MIIAIIQPSFLPWLGYFEQMAFADIFVYFDDVQYTKRDWRNRNQFKSPYGVKSISVPVYKGRGRHMLINEGMINYEQKWQRQFISKIEEWYKDAPFFEIIFPPIKETIQFKYDLLVDLNYSLNEIIMSFLEISIPVFKSSDIVNKSPDRNQKIIDICKHHKADILYDGKAAEAFIDKELFGKNNIDVIFQDYRPALYSQLYGKFESHLSALDLLMNCGPDSREILLSSPLPNEILHG